MKKIWSVLFALVCGMILYAYNIAAENVAGPKLVLKEKEFDFGEVIQGDTIEHVFMVANHGNETLEITKVSPG